MFSNVGVYNIPVYDVDEFIWLNSKYIVREFNEELDRDIVRLESVCFLRMVHTFANVEPGIDNKIFLANYYWGSHGKNDY